jgi:thiol-disulfide isomerase/thioredoxin
VRVLRCVSLVAVCLALAGCHAFGKKPQAPGGPAARAPAGPDLGPRTDLARNGTPSPAIPDTGNPSAALTTGGSGLLAGQVIDSYNRAPPRTYVQVSLPPGPGETAGAPIEIEATSQGFFTIPGLKPGRHYQLIARAADGDRVLAGTTWATPPNPKVLIRISEDLATQHTPPVPGAPKNPAAAPPPPSWPEAGTSTGAVGTASPSPAANRGSDQGWAPAQAGPPQPSPGSSPPASPMPSSGAGLGAPIKDDGPPPPPSAMGARPEDIAGRDQVAGLRDSPPVTMPGPGQPAPPPRPGVPLRNPYPQAGGPAPVPSCSLTGRQLYNFALNDLSGQPWEFRNRRGRLVLLDFWGTWCVHCLHTVPHLNILQERYGPYGLEVIGIAYEEGTSQEQVQKVSRVRQRLAINYRLLMGSDRSRCPVRSQFAVSIWPTMVLLDESGRIIWRAEGVDRQHLTELEAIIRQRLNAR